MRNVIKWINHASPRRDGFDMRILHPRTRVFVGLAILFILPGCVRADGIVAVSVPEVTVTGSNICGPGKDTLCVETFSESFDWNDTTESVVPGTAQISATGPLGTISFLTSYFDPLGGSAGGALIILVWANSAGSGLDTSFYVSQSGLTPGIYPILGASQPGDAGVGLGCNDSPLDQNCAAEFIVSGVQGSAPMPAVVSAVPECDTLFMLSMGLSPLLVLSCAHKQARIRLQKTLMRTSTVSGV